MSNDAQMNYMAKFSLDMSDLTKGLTGAAISFDAIMLAAKESFAIIKQGYDETIGKAVAFGEAIHTLADITGESEENIQRLRSAGNAVGTDFDSIATTIRMFSQRIGDTGTSGETLRAKLAEIGVQVKDNNGNYRSSTELYMEINRELERMPSVYERNTLALDIYGRSWSTVVDMISNADRASQAFKKAEVISAEDIKQAKEFGIALDVIGARFDKLKVKVGMNLIDALGNNALLTGDLTGTALGNLLGINNGNNKRGADREDGELNLKKENEAIAPLIDKYSGLTGVGLKYAEAADAVQKAQTEVNEALASKSQSAYDAANLNLARTTEAFQKLRKEMYETSQAAVVATQQLTPHVDVTVEDSINQHLGGYQDRYGQVDQLFQGIGGMNQSNQYTQEMKALQARAIGASGGLGSQGLDWRYTGENESIANQAMAIKAAYDKSTNIYVNVPEGTPADMADRVAAAISRALAQQVVT